MQNGGTNKTRKENSADTQHFCKVRLLSDDQLGKDFNNQDDLAGPGQASKQ